MFIDIADDLFHGFVCYQVEKVSTPTIEVTQLLKVGGDCSGDVVEVLTGGQQERDLLVESITRGEFILQLIESGEGGVHLGIKQLLIFEHSFVNRFEGFHCIL